MTDISDDANKHSGPTKTGYDIWNAEVQERTVQLTIIPIHSRKKIIYGLSGPIKWAIYSTCAVYMRYRSLAVSA